MNTNKKGPAGLCFHSGNDSLSRIVAIINLWHSLFVYMDDARVVGEVYGGRVSACVSRSFGRIQTHSVHGILVFFSVL